MDPAEFAEAVVPLLAPTGLTVYLEPGRFLVGSAGVLLTRVLYRKHSGGKEFVVVDAGMNDLVRPSHYQAYHEIVELVERGGPRPASTWSGRSARPATSWRSTGPCPAWRPAMALAVLGAGAYGFVMASNYNSRPRPPEVIVDGGSWWVARERERVEDLFRGRLSRERREDAVANHHDGILIIDFGSQYTQLIARRVREAHVYCEIHPPTRTVDWIRDWKPKGIILSGGPNSVYGENVPTADPELLELGTPVLGLCYGMQLLAHLSGGNVTRASRREYGRANLRVEGEGGRLFQGFGPGEETPVWMSHGDQVDAPPPQYRVTASSVNSPIAAIEHNRRPLFGVQFHPEVAHTPRGGEILNNFLFEICGCTPDWTPGTSSSRKSSASGRS